MILGVAALVMAITAACAPMAPTATTTVESVDVSRYLGTWYELGSVKQFFSVGLVNSKAEYSLRPDGNIRVENTGNYFAANGPVARIVGSAFPVDASNARLNVSFSGSNSSTGVGNYWIVDLDPEYRWAIVSDPAGNTGFILTRTRTVSDATRSELKRLAVQAGIDVDRMTDTPQL